MATDKGTLFLARWWTNFATPMQYNIHECKTEEQDPFNKRILFRLGRVRIRNFTRGIRI